MLTIVPPPRLAGSGSWTNLVRSNSNIRLNWITKLRVLVGLSHGSRNLCVSQRLQFSSPRTELKKIPDNLAGFNFSASLTALNDEVFFRLVVNNGTFYDH